MILHSHTLFRNPHVLYFTSTGNSTTSVNCLIKCLVNIAGTVLTFDACGSLLKYISVCNGLSDGA